MKEIKLTQGKVALVDDEDFELINKNKWQAHKEGNNNWYATRSTTKNGKKITFRMHRVILGLSDSNLLCDHRNGNGLNNQRNNLRICSYKENQRNMTSHCDGTSKFLGVSYRKDRGKFRARILVNGKELFLGYFKDEIEAAIAYNNAASIHYKEFANLNKI